MFGKIRWGLTSAWRAFNKDNLYVKKGWERPVGYWLLVSASGVLGMIILGGYTRLSHSGLSMTDWKPLTQRYPSTGEEWETQFEKYKQCSEYKTVNQDISLDKFQEIYRVEFLHRQAGRCLGLLYGLPFIALSAAGIIRRKLFPKLLGLLCLGGFQGYLGWRMVKSGLDEKPLYQSRPRVNPLYLGSHLVMATTLYTMLLNSSLNLLLYEAKVQAVPISQKYVRLIQIFGKALMHMVLLNIISGAMMSGIDAGKVYNTWPLMNGEIIPTGLLRESPFWKNFYENSAMVQFNHRTLAYMTWSGSIGLLAMILKYRIGGQMTIAALLAVFLVNYQAASGILTVLAGAPREKAQYHQMTAFITYTSILFMLALVKKCKFV